MNLFLAILTILFLVGVRPCWRGANENYIAREAIQPIKGLFILLVFMSHFLQYIRRVPDEDGVFVTTWLFLGQMIVVPFLFYSGYGVTESIRKKGSDYLRQFPVNRILSVWFEFAVAVLIYIVSIHFILGVKFKLAESLLCILGWKSAGNSNWYIFSIVILYFLTWISYWIFGSNQKRPEWLPHLVLTGLALLLIDILSYCRPNYVYNTLLAYVAGCWFSQYREKIEPYFRSVRIFWIGLIVMAVSFCMFQMEWKATAMCELAALAFAFFTLLLSTRVRFYNPVLSYCGRHLFSLYVLQRLPMHLLRKTVVAQNKYIYFIVCLAITFVISWMFDLIVPRLWKRIIACFRFGQVMEN